MFNLFMDTATERGIIGLAKEGKLLEAILLPIGLQNSQHLFPALIDLLKKQQLTMDQIQLISVGVGPGSYTGMRVAAATAQSLSYALHLPLVGFCSLEAFMPLNGEFGVILDAKYGGVYFSKRGGEVQILQIEEVPPLPLITPKASPKLLQAFPHIMEEAPSGERIAALTWQKYQQGNYSQDGQLKLLYLR